MAVFGTYSAIMTELTAATPAPDPKPTTAEKPTSLPPTKGHKFVRWLRRHHRMLTFVGTLIIFGTFIVKDALREQLKDLADSLKSAKAQFIEELNTSESFAAYARIERKVDSVKAYILDPADLKKLIDDKLEQLTLAGERIQRMDSALANIESLSEKLSADKNIALLIGNIQSQRQTALQKYAEVRKKGGILIPDPRAYGGVRYPLGEAEYSAEKLKDAVSDLSRIVLDRTESVLKKNERRSSIPTWASYFLYTLGWGLGLVGRLVGVEAGAGE
jgi:hypothetical protein